MPEEATELVGRTARAVLCLGYMVKTSTRDREITHNRAVIYRRMIDATIIPYVQKTKTNQEVT